MAGDVVNITTLAHDWLILFVDKPTVASPKITTDLCYENYALPLLSRRAVWLAELHMGSQNGKRSAIT